MKLHLVLFRHAQAEDAPLGGSDHDRRLTKHGEKQAAHTAKHLAKAEYLPTLVLVSDAQRTLGTWQHAQSYLGKHATVETHHAIYKAGVLGLANLLGAQDVEQHHCIALIGHNPHISELASELSGQDLRFSKGEAMVFTIKADSWAEAVHAFGDWRLAASIGGKPS